MRSALSEVTRSGADARGQGTRARAARRGQAPRGRWGGRRPEPTTPGRCWGRDGALTRGAAAGGRMPPGPLLDLGYESELLTRYLRCCLRPARHGLMTHLTPGPVLILSLRTPRVIRFLQPTLRHPAP